jgi:Tol biopolymer transport system component
MISRPLWISAAIALLPTPLIGEAVAQDSTAIYVMQANGSGARRVAFAPEFKRVGHPRWSRDGKRLAFHGWDGPPGVRRLFVADADGGRPAEVVADGQFAAWSPDDKQLAFQVPGQGRAVASWVQNLDGQGRTLLVEGTAPRWSPDGSQLAFLENNELIVRDLVTDTQRSVLDGDWQQIQPGFDWSPDGKQLAFVGRRDNRVGLWIVDAADAAPRLRLRGNLMGQLSWSPDGKQLAITLDSVIHLLEPTGTKPPSLVPGQKGNSRDPAWSPDGKSIAFSSNRDLQMP